MGKAVLLECHLCLIFGFLQNTKYIQSHIPSTKKLKVNITISVDIRSKTADAQYQQQLVPNANASFSCPHHEVSEQIHY